ncbi:Orotidine 5'-phosphate decarboxylase [Mycena kentingensis (nom. inval.)]|nr:Orotidine 5'-phosphate decarboxylase [Mycena kentingensis (nom. inval.)]
MSYAERAQKHKNPAARLLLETIARKKSNLAVSVDVVSAKDFLNIIDVVGPFVCLVKTHVDIIEDFTPQLITDLQALSAKHDFVIFEDRKFADIGNTVALQYSSGIHKIASWSHITNAHPVPGPSIIAEMSTKGSLATGSYTDAAVEMARANQDFVMGFIAQRRMDAGEDEDFVILTPGVGLDVQDDGMGQQYRSPHQVVFESGCDVIIVGRGIYGKDPTLVDKIVAQAKRYQQAGWDAYSERIKQ